VPLAINPFDLLNAKKIYVPAESGGVATRVIVEGVDGSCYSLYGMQGSDADSDEELFILYREEISNLDVLPSGKWKNVDVRKTQISTVYKFRESEEYRGVQEFKEATLFCEIGRVAISKKSDEFGIESLSVVFCPAGELRGHYTELLDTPGQLG
jgi:hypothetical protein